MCIRPGTYDSCVQEANPIVMEHVELDVVNELRTGLRCSETFAWVLASRGVRSVDEARRLLDRPDEDPGSFHDPLLLGDMAAAVERVHFAIEQGELIVVHGDYDADGVCSTTLLVEGIEALGGRVEHFLPERFSNGYGLQLETVENLASRGSRLLITVDCGITAVEQVAQARDRGIDTIILDHHEPGETLPAGIICSTRPSSYPFPDICATVVAGKLVQALGAPYGDSAHELEAIATIADCMPLIGENRAIVRRGLKALRRTSRPGLRALLSACRVHPRDADEETVAFKVAPRLNAAGRIAHPDRALELLRSDASSAEQAAATLHEVNEQRRRIEQRITAEAIAQVEGWSDEQRAARCYVVAGEDWHEGVVGIVASRLVDRFSRPVVAISSSEPLARGSARSLDTVNLHAALAACDDVLVRWGGHRVAGGLTVEPARIDELRARLAAWGEDNISDEDLHRPRRADAVLDGSDLTLGLVEELAQLAPFGTHNPRPQLLLAGATALDVQTVGDGSHLRLRIELDGTTAPVIAFGLGEHAEGLRQASTIDLAATIGVNRFRGAETLQLEAAWLQPATPTLPAVQGTACAGSCTLSCTERVPLQQLLARASEPHPAAAAGIEGPSMLPAAEPMLASPGCVDLRNRGIAGSHVIRLLAAGSSVAVVCADVARRRELMATRLRPSRIGASWVLASSRCDLTAARQRIRRAVSAGVPRLILIDHDALAQLVDELPGAVDVVVVLDPPAVADDRDAIVGIGRPLHLVWGAREVRFAREAAGAVADVRATLGPAWKALEAGIDDPAELEAWLLAGGDRSAPLLHPPAAVGHALHELTGRGLITVDAAAGRISTCARTATATNR